MSGGSGCFARERQAELGAISTVGGKIEIYEIYYTVSRVHPLILLSSATTRK